MNLRKLLLLAVWFAILCCSNAQAASTEITRNNYTLDEICKMLNKPLSKASKIIVSPNPQAESELNYFLRIYNNGNDVEPGDKFEGDPEYQFIQKKSKNSKNVVMPESLKKLAKQLDKAVQGVRFYREKNIVKIVSYYYKASSAEEAILNSLDGAFSEGGASLVIDRLKNKERYVLLSMTSLNPMRGIKDFDQYVLYFKQDNTHYFEATISKSILKKEERQRLDKMIQEDVRKN